MMGWLLGWMLLVFKFTVLLRSLGMNWRGFRKYATGLGIHIPFPQLTLAYGPVV
jgi:hypothetical protein